MDISKASITRRLESALGGLEDEFRNLYTKEEFSWAVTELKRSAGKSDHSSKLKKLFGLLDRCGISYEKGRPDSYYEELVESQDIPSFADGEGRIMNALYSLYANYPAPSEYMERLVDRLCTAEDGWEGDSLRLRILKQFIKYGNYLYDAKCGSRTYIRSYAAQKGAADRSADEVTSHIDDHIFDVLFEKETTKEQRKFGGKYGLLKIADDLASGKFRLWGVTRQNLYYFAMVYGMTYYAGPEDGSRIFDRMTDIEVNLFRDYYNNNFVRFITEAYVGKLQEFESDPSGQGINYKNYAEMVYLYYISRDMSPEEKIRGSYKMITEIKDEMVGRGAPEGWSGEGETIRLRDMIRSSERQGINSEDILNRSEEEFKTFLCENYFCDTSGSYYPQEGAKSKISPMQLGTGQFSAYENYLMILDGIKDLGIDLEECDYGLWFTDVAAYGAEPEAKDGGQAQDENYGRFMDLLEGVDKYMTGGLRADSPETVTRSSMLTAFYYYYNALRTARGVSRVMSFEDVFNDFKLEADGYLEESGYQLLSGKNLFDVLIAFSSYAYLYM